MSEGYESIDARRRKRLRFRAWHRGIREADLILGPFADAHIDALSKKYTGRDKYANRRPGEVRVTVKILPEKVQSMG